MYNADDNTLRDEKYVRSDVFNKTAYLSWMDTYMPLFLLHIITHPCFDINGGLI